MLILINIRIQVLHLLLIRLFVVPHLVRLQQTFDFAWFDCVVPVFVHDFEELLELHGGHLDFFGLLIPQIDKCIDLFDVVVGLLLSETPCTIRIVLNK